LAMNDVRQVINQYNGELQKIVNYKVMKWPRRLVIP
jgi:hypothetical protein